jgi:hypothetical protein
MLLSLYYTEASTSVPLQQHSTPFSNAVATHYTIAPGSTVYTYVGSTLTTSEMGALDNFKKSSKTVSYQVGFAVYVIALSGWIGWWLFAVFCGVGLATLPFDMYMAFIFRPRILAPDELATKEAEVQERTAELLEITVMLKRDFFDNKSIFKIAVQWNDDDKLGTRGLANITKKTLTLSPEAFSNLKKANANRNLMETLQMVVSHEVGHFQGLTAHSRRCVDVLSYYSNDAGEKCFIRDNGVMPKNFEYRSLLPTACDIQRCRIANGN